jgi:protein involved in polysaccharide export with SLBB domain
MKFIFLILISICFFTEIQTFGQEIPKNVNVNELNNSQIKQAKEALDNSGVPRDVAIELARKKGVTEQQIQDMVKRMDELDSNPGNTPTKSDPLNPLDQIKETIDKAEKQTLEEKLATASSPNSNGIRFGSYIFNGKNLTFEPNLNLPTPKNYRISISDQIIISIWGNSQASYQLTVDRNGHIRIPDVSPIYVAGLTFDEATNKIKEKLSSIYADMLGDTPSTFAQIDLGQMRSIQVNLVGEANAPGTYTLPATATVFNALYLSGGPNAIGSFRNIKLMRDGKVFKIIDVYKFLMSGDLTDNLILQDNDIIFIPTLEKQVKVSGEFKRNGLFELKEKETLPDLIKYAGGYTDETYLYRMKLYRKTQQGMRVEDFIFKNIKDKILENGDVLVSGKTKDFFENRVVINGSVLRPGEYEWKNKIKLSELIQKADSITPDAYLKGGHILRYNKDLTTRIIPFSLTDVLNGKSDLILEPEDVITIKSHFQMKEQPNITISGEVLRPFSSQYVENLTLRDAIYMADGFKEDADSSYIEVSRRLGYKKEATLGDTVRIIFTFTLPRDLNMENDAGKFKLEPFDRISVRKAPGYRQPEEVTVMGEVKFAGQYALNTKSLRISDLIAKAGGLTTDAYPEGAQFSRTNTVFGTEILGIDLDNILKHPDDQNNLFLMNGDHLSIPKKLQTVKVSGNVQNSMSLTYLPSQSLKQYVNMAGGFDESTNRRKIYVRYPNGTTATTKSFIFRSYPNVKPGTEIIIPKKPEKQHIDNTGKWLGIASTMATIAIAISTLVK